LSTVGYDGEKWKERATPDLFRKLEGNTLEFESPSVNAGLSGGGLLTSENAIVAMVLEAQDDGGTARPLSRILDWVGNAAPLRLRLAPCSIAVQSEPRGATVTVAGIVLGPTPQTFLSPANTPQLLTITSDRQHSIERSVQCNGPTQKLTLPVGPPPKGGWKRPWGAAEWSGIGVGLGGLTALGVGGYFALQATAKDSESHDDCSNDYCGPRGLAVRNHALRLGDAATIFSVGGAALVAAGSLTFAIGRLRGESPDEMQIEISGSFGPSSVGGVASGRF
jgi:hypothetical protein